MHCVVRAVCILTLLYYPLHIIYPPLAVGGGEGGGGRGEGGYRAPLPHESSMMVIASTRPRTPATQVWILNLCGTDSTYRQCKSQPQSCPL